MWLGETSVKYRVEGVTCKRQDNPIKSEWKAKFLQLAANGK